jgi:hypothetical protein
MSVGMGLETRVHCLNGVICQTRVVIIIMVILVWFKLNVGSCFRLLWSFRFMPIFFIAFVLLLSCSVVMPHNLVVVVGGVTR